MPLVIPLDARSDRSRLTVDLGGVDVSIRWYWLPRCAGWYVDLEQPDGTPNSTGLRLTPAAPLNAPGASDALPDGRFYVGGPDTYGRDDLGTQVTLAWWSAEEIASLG